MAVSLNTPVTGGAQTGLTSPTYTVAVDNPPDTNAKQWTVTSLGGTQTGVTVHSASSPFSVSFWRPKVMSLVPYRNPSTGQAVSSVKKNAYKVITLKGVTPYVNAPIEVAMGRIELMIPAGADTYDPANVRAMISLLIGSLSQISAGLGDTTVTGSL